MSHPGASQIKFEEFIVVNFNVPVQGVDPLDNSTFTSDRHKIQADWCRQDGRETLFILDLWAITNFLLRNYYLSLYCSNISRNLFIWSVSYSFISYFLGKYYNIFSFHPDWNTQMVYHSFMHLSTSYSSYLIIKELSQRWPCNVVSL